jgi:tyrosinase
VLSLKADDPILTFYGKAMAAMQAKPLSEPTSWRYQAAIHDYVRAADPNADDASDLPLPADSARFWRQCEHHGWFFLPWHRMYLHHFEMIVLSEVMKQGGPEDWALPYWNYSASDANAQLLPKAFQQGSTTGLFIPRRDPRANAGQPFLAAADIGLGCLTEGTFNTGGKQGFGGSQPPTPKNHGGGPNEGAVESIPHDTIHGALNGDDRLPNGSLKPLKDRGFMGNFTRAPLDPIFWVHHCNIDRLWEVWVKAGHSNPTSADWLTNVSWDFNTAAKTVETMTSSMVVDTRKLFYIYDDTSSP